MKRLLPCIAGVLSALLLWNVSAAAQEKKIPVKLAIIDIREIQRNAAVVKDINAQIGKYRSAFQAEIQKEENELRNAQQELARQRSILAPDAFSEARRNFDRRLASVQRKVQVRKQELELVFREAMEKVRAALDEVITSVANEQSLTLILRKDQTVLVATQLEITRVVLARLDKKLPSLKVSEPGK